MFQTYRRVLCDNCQAFVLEVALDSTNTNHQSLAVAIGPMIRHIDLCKDCQQTLISPLLAVMDGLPDPDLPPIGSKPKRQAPNSKMALPHACRICEEVFPTSWHLAWHVRQERAEGRHLNYKDLPRATKEKETP